MCEGLNIGNNSVADKIGTRKYGIELHQKE
jgi:hypothetical protein